MVTIQRVDIPTFLDTLKSFDLEEFFDKEGDDFYEFLLDNYPQLIPDDEVTLYEIIDDITPPMLLEYFLKKGYVSLC